ncbi:MAG TPA: hypothetical protein VFR31_21725 [Thermoanaerobaculia bacterium]|nr:hypothetical protein [Thermoanaerobaculia bacterium]
MKKQQSEEAIAKMVSEGWKQISEGVFERQLGPGKVEHLGFGREGLAWTVGEMSRKLEFLRQEQGAYPSEKLARIIDELTLKVTEARLELSKLDLNASEGLSSITANVAGGSCSSICYSATASAYPLTSVQGVAAVAEGKFNSTCGYSGDTYAYAYARATSGTTTTTVTQSDPRSGTNVTSSAFASANGGSVSGIPCYSEASSYAQSSALGISYSTSATNSTCPVPPCNVTISGTDYEFFSNYSCVSRTWTANVSSGCTASSYQWKDNGTVVSTGSTYTRNVCGYHGSFNLELTVNGTAYDSHYVTVDYYDPCGYCGCYQICP